MIKEQANKGWEESGCWDERGGGGAYRVFQAAIDCIALSSSEVRKEVAPTKNPIKGNLTTGCNDQIINGIWTDDLHVRREPVTGDRWLVGSAGEGYLSMHGGYLSSEHTGGLSSE